MAAVTERIAAWWRRASMPLRLIAVNAGVFVLLRVAVIIGLFAGAADPMHTILRLVELPGSLRALIAVPWTAVTYMFAQYDLLHLLFNVLWLYWFGEVMLYRCTPAQLFVLYLYGGLAGGVLFIAGYSLLPYFAGVQGLLIGSSASVMAIVTATAILMPDFRMRFLLLGSIRLKWIAIASVALVLLGVSGSNAGGEIAHVGGIAAGTLFALQLRRERDITRPLTRLWATVSALLGRRRLTARPAPRREPTLGADDRATLDAILDKIKRSGYSALTPEERRRLFEVSRNIK